MHDFVSFRKPIFDTATLSNTNPRDKTVPNQPFRKRLSKGAQWTSCIGTPEKYNTYPSFGLSSKNLTLSGLLFSVPMITLVA